jgi:hypothetical protein
MLDFEQRVGDARNFLSVPEAGTQHPKLLACCELLFAPEQRLYATPGEKIRMNDLI